MDQKWEERNWEEKDQGGTSALIAGRSHQGLIVLAEKLFPHKGGGMGGGGGVSLRGVRRRKWRGAIEALSRAKIAFKINN